MVLKKSFVGVVPASVIALPVNASAPGVGIPAQTVVRFPPGPGRQRSFDFKSHYSVKIDAITYGIDESGFTLTQSFASLYK